MTIEQILLLNNRNVSIKRLSESQKQLMLKPFTHGGYSRFLRNNRIKETIFTLPKELEEKVLQIREETKHAQMPLREFGYEIFDLLAMNVKYDQLFATEVQQRGEEIFQFEVRQNGKKPYIRIGNGGIIRIIGRTKYEFDEEPQKIPKYKPAKVSWEDKKAICLDMSILYTACMRVAGINSNVAAVYRDYNGKIVNHACSIAYLEKTTLVDIAYFRFDIEHQKYQNSPDNEVAKLCTSMDYLKRQEQATKIDAAILQYIQKQRSRR